MIKPLDEYSPEDRAFVEYVERLRRQSPPKSLTEQAREQGVGPINPAEIRAILAEPDDGE